MNKLPPTVFAARPVVILDLPLAPNTRLLHPEQVMLKVGRFVHDVGAFCYGVRSNKSRKANDPRDVILASFRKERVRQIRQVITVFSMFLEEGGKRPVTVVHHLIHFKTFMDWADTNGCPDCLAGGDATRQAYRLYANDVEDRLRRHEFESANGFHLQSGVLTVLEAVTGLIDLGKGVRFIRNRSGSNGGTEPASQHDFAHALALNDSFFQGLCDLILENQPFPFRLTMPKFLGWEQDHLWVFPTVRWFLPPHQWGEAREQMGHSNWTCNYEQGRLATVEELSPKYSGSDRIKHGSARFGLRQAAKGLASANSDARDHYRRMLAMTAHNAFYFLFLANTGGNASPVADIETDGVLDVATANAGYRTTKWRAQGKEVSLIVPVAFVPALRRFMELRRYLLNGQEFPHLFLTLGGGKRDDPAQINLTATVTNYKLLRRIDPQLPKMSPRKIRATVSDYYHRKHDAVIEAAVLQHQETTAEKSYNAGTEAGQHTELTLLMEKIAQKAQQKVVANGTVINDARVLEDGGVCPSYGQPESISSDAPVTPNCKTGCLFCAKRVLIAGEEDTRKVASAACLMEQLIIGPKSEAEFRPQIVKCDEDLAKIRAFEGCESMVDRVKKDVFENGNMTPYFADKYQLFLELGIL